MAVLSVLLWLVSFLLFVAGLVLCFAKRRRKQGLILIAGSVVLWMLSLGMLAASAPTGDPRPTETAGSQEINAPTKTVVSSPPRSEPSRMLQVDARQLVQAYMDNEVAADARYKGSHLEITGIVGRIGKDILDNPYVTLGTADDFEIRQVQCMLAKRDELTMRRTMELKKGQRLTVRGRNDGLMMNVIVKDCVIP